MSARDLLGEHSQPVHKASALPWAPAVVLAQLIAVIDSEGTALVRRRDDAAGITQRARIAVDLHAGHVGHDVVLGFENGDANFPIVTAVLRPSLDMRSNASGVGQVEVDVDGERLLVTAREQLVLRCGKASLTLTKAGKVLIQGTYLSSRSSGVNRIKGGSVDIN